jgi:hypothetical protein
MASNLRENEQVCRLFGQALFSADGTLGNIPGLLKRVLKEEMWRKRELDHPARIVEHERFEDWVTAKPLDGIGATVDMIRNLVRDDVEACDLLDRELKRPVGYNLPVDNINSRPDGTSRARALRRLRKDRPDIHERVIAGELSPHAGMVEAGFRKVPTPEEIIKRNFQKLDDSRRMRILDWLMNEYAPEV